MEVWEDVGAGCRDGVRALVGRLRPAEEASRILGAGLGVGEGETVTVGIGEGGRTRWVIFFFAAWKTQHRTNHRIVTRKGEIRV